MKRVVLPILLLVAAFFLAQCASTEEKPMPVGQTVASGGSPVAEFPETEHDLGKMVDGQEYSYEFRVRNTGAGKLEIKKVLPG
jgi:predicted small secreted protein